MLILDGLLDFVNSRNSSSISPLDVVAGWYQLA